MLRCAYTGKAIEGSSDAIWDDGEWISWEYISQLAKEEEEHPDDLERYQDQDVEAIFKDLVSIARDYHRLTGRYLSIWGELGELFAEVMYGMRRHKPYVKGSDGRIGNDWIEVKTISPEKQIDEVRVKRAGNFSALIIVKIDEQLNFESRFIDRKKFKKGTGKFFTAKWE